jgi:membrane protease YdiL (CAAX protease family)
MLEELLSFAKRPIYESDINKSISYRLGYLFKLLVLALCSSILLLMAAGTIQGLFSIELGKHAIDDLFENNSVVIIFFLAVLVAPISEELLFRGPLFFFKNSKFFAIAFYILTLIFGVIHISNFELSPQVWLLSPILVAPQISVGFLLGFIRVKFGLLWSIIMHACYNMVLIVPLLLLKLLDIPIE